MRPRTKRKIANAAGWGMGLAGVAVFAVALFVPSEEGQSNASGLRLKDSQQEPMDLAVSARLDSIIRSTRLQRPLVDPPKKEKKSNVVRQLTLARIRVSDSFHSFLDRLNHGMPKKNVPVSFSKWNRPRFQSLQADTFPAYR